MATIREIAKIAGVSTATVSRIINGKGEASPETMERVLKLVAELNYQPNQLAKTLSQRTSNLLAIMLPNLMNPFFGELTTAIERVANQQDIQILVCNTDDQRSKVEQMMEFIINHYAFGAVISSMQVVSADLERLERAGVRTLTVDRSSFEHPFSAVIVDQTDGFFDATSLLLARGARHIALLTGPAELGLSIAREEGYRVALAQHRGGVDPIILRGDFSIDSGYQTVFGYLSRGRPLDGILASNDFMAIGAMRACREFGLSIPDDVRVIGNDDLDLDNYLAPPLSTLSQRHTAVARAVIDELVARRDEGAAPRKVVLRSELILRGTT